MSQLQSSDKEDQQGLSCQISSERRFESKALGRETGADYPIMTTGDGSLTFFSEEFGQPFHNPTGAYQEALEKFVRPCKLEERAHQQSTLRLLDICLGLGYNSGVALEVVHQQNPHCQVDIIGLERSPEVPWQACEQGLGFGELQEWISFIKTGTFITTSWQGLILWGDARQTLAKVPLNWADAVFLDPFSPSVCPELWTVEFLTLIAQRIHPQGYLTTYSCSASVRSGLQAAGFHIGSTPAVGRPWPGTVASLWDQTLPPLSVMEQEHLQTRAAVPFRDPGGQLDRAEIRRLRQQEQQQSPLESTSAWKKRWWERGLIATEAT